MENWESPSTNKSISEYRNSAFQNSGIMISECKNIHLKTSMTLENRHVLFLNRFSKEKITFHMYKGY
jgi:hypothetical protein